MCIFRLFRLFILIGLSCLFSVSGALAQSYSTRDAQYVTSSRNEDVLRYIVCLETVVGRLPRSMSVADRISRSEVGCRSAAARLPQSSHDPDASSIRSMILECGFRPGEGSPDFDCGAATLTNKQLVADEIYLDPRRIELGKWLEGFALDGNDLWVAESGQRTIAKVAFRTGVVQKRFKVGRLPVDTVVVDGNTFTLVVTDNLILQHSKSGRKSKLVSLKDCPETMIASGTTLFVLGQPTCSSESGRVTRVDTQNGTKKLSPDLGEWTTAITAVGSDVWVGHARYTAISIVNKERLTVEKLDLSGIEVWALASNNSSVFAGGRYASTDADGSIVMIDARSREEIARYSVAELVAKITANDEYVVAVGSKGTIWVLSAIDLSLIRTIYSATGTYNPGMVHIAGNDLVISAGTYRGENGAILVFSDYLPKGLSHANAPRPKTRPGNPARPSTRPVVGVQTGFPIIVGSYGGRVRNAPNLNGQQIASTQEGDDVTLLERTNSMYEGYPWFLIRIENSGQIGYQWGGIICSYEESLIGASGICQQPKSDNLSDYPVDWTGSPQDPRFNNREYNQISREKIAECNVANNAPNSSSFNNETAYWDCADKWLQELYATK